ncbi:MAG TPA: alkaline phosphatase D family protein, partial [Nannocystis sp.]
DEAFAVAWELASDEAFTDIVQSGTADAVSMWAHSLHIEVNDLEPDTWYWYRFKVGTYTSPAGRTRTTPAFDAQPERLRFATASCQDYSDGYYTAYRAMAKEDLDLVLFLGDYIYENAATGPVRSHGAPEPMTLDEYRVRHALYKSDRDLQAMHQRCPWALIWDDHEVENDYAADHSQDDAPIAEWLARRAAAYQAYYEHMPLRLPPPSGPDYKIYHALKWGDLAELWLLDTRQYRSVQNCMNKPGQGCEGWEEFEGTLLGDEQETWLKEQMAATAAIWKCITQQVVFSTVNFGGSLVNFDQWDGYPKARQRILDFIVDEQLDNVVVLSGDIHLGGLGDLTAIADDDESPVIATEIVTTSITSSANVPPEAIEGALGGLPLLKYVNAHSRGYVSHDVTRAVYTVRCVIVDSIVDPMSPAMVEVERHIDAGVAGYRPV